MAPREKEIVPWIYRKKMKKQKIIWQMVCVCGIVSLQFFINLFWKGAVMAFTIKVLDRKTRMPQSDIRVLYIHSPGCKKEQWTGEDGCVHYNVIPTRGVRIRINGHLKSERLLIRGENVFYVSSWYTPQLVNRGSLASLFFCILLLQMKKLEKRGKIIECGK